MLTGPDPRARRTIQGLLLGVVTCQLAFDLGFDLPRHLINFTILPYLVAAVLAFRGPAWWRRTWWALLTGAVGLWVAVVCTPLPGRAMHWLMVHDGPAPADVIVVLSGSTRSTFPRVSSTERMIAGLTLLEAGYAPAITFTGEEGAPTNQFHRQAPELMGRMGLDTTAVVPFVSLGHSPMNTRTEALAIRAMCAEHGWRRVLLVTSPSHTRRAKLTFEGAGVPVRVVAANTGQYDLADPWPGPPLLIWRDVMYELQGLLLYRLQGHLAEPST